MIHIHCFTNKDKNNVLFIKVSASFISKETLCVE